MRLLQESGFGYSVNRLGRRLTEQEIIELGQDCHGVIAGAEPYTEYVLERMPNLRCISRCGVGVDNIALAGAKGRGVAVLNTPEVVVQPVAEITVAMTLDLLKKITWHDAAMKERRWERQTGYLLKGKIFGVMGLGRIGRRVAELMSRLEAEVRGADLFPDPKWAAETGVRIVPPEELLKVSDIFSIHLANVEGHPFQLGAREIAMMKRGAMVVNVSRGAFIDEAALYDALKSGALSGAALDVFSAEPYQGPLCGLDNVVLTPHIATFTRESRLQMEVEATMNLIDYLSRDESPLAK